MVSQVYRSQCIFSRVLGNTHATPSHEAGKEISFFLGGVFNAGTLSGRGSQNKAGFLSPNKTQQNKQ